METYTDITINTNIIHSTFPSLDTAQQWLRNHGYVKLVMDVLGQAPEGSWHTEVYRFEQGEYHAAILSYYEPRVHEVDMERIEKQLELDFDA